MKHNYKIIIVLVGIFFVSQIVGLLIVNQYIDHTMLDEEGVIEFQTLPYDVERPPVAQSQAVWYIAAAIVVGTVLLLIIVHFKKHMLWKLWYFLSVFITMTVALAAFVHEILAAVLAFLIGYIKIFKQKMWLHNISEIFIYGGLAAIFVPIMNIFSAVALLIIISLYDMYAVWKSKHMVKLAEFTTESNVFAGLSVPYHEKTGKIHHKATKSLKKKSAVKNAILGGGDIGFPLLFAGVIMKELMLIYPVLTGFLYALIIPLFTGIALYILFIEGDKNKFYPAMPFLSIGCFIGYGLLIFFAF